MLGVYGGKGIASPLCSKVTLADSVEDPLEAPPLCSKAALADSVEDPLEASPLCCEVPLADSPEHILREHHLNEASMKKHFDANFHPAPARKIDSLGSKQFCKTMTPQARNSASESGSGTSSVSFRVSSLGRKFASNCSTHSSTDAEEFLLRGGINPPSVLFYVYTSGGINPPSVKLSAARSLWQTVRNF